MMNCSELALRLNENYYTTSRFSNSDESLAGYLNQNGILLTMCLGQSIFGGLCRLGILSNHVSASWIRNFDTGFRIFGPPPPDELQIGLILDPTTSDINCVYPIDAVTDTRLNNGCGFQPDAPEAPNNYRRMLERYDIIKYKNDAFGKATKWSDIDCEEFLGMAFGPVAVNNSECSFAIEQDAPIRLESGGKFLYETWSYVIGQPVCNVTKAWSEPTSTTTDTILYMGSCIWKPSDWSSMVDTMGKVASDYPRAYFWNEIILAKPRALNDIVQAVFLIDDGFHDQNESEAAKKEARRLGKPLLILHPPGTNSKLTFTCDESIATNTLRSIRAEE